MMSYDTYLSLISSFSMIIPRFIHVAADGIISFFFMANIPLCICATSSVSISLLMGIGLLSCPGYCKQRCSEHWSACIFLNYGFLQIHTQEWDCWIIWQFLGFFLIFYFFIFGCARSLLLCRLFSSCGKWQLLASCGARASRSRGFSCCLWSAVALKPDCRASVVVACGLRSCGFGALEQRLNSCGMWAQLLLSMWNLPGSGVEPMSPALAGRFFTTEPPAKPYIQFFKEPPYCSPQWLYQFTFLLTL